MKNSILWVALLLYSCTNTQDQQNLEKQNSNLISQLAETERIQLIKQKIMFANWNKPLGAFKVSDQNGNKHFVEAVGEKSVLVFRYSDEYCSSCLDFGIEMLKEMEKSIDGNKLIVLASFENPRNELIFRSQNHLKSRIYTISNDAIHLPIEKYHKPYFFMFNKKYNMPSHYFWGDKKIDSFAIQYISVISEKLK